MASNTPGNVIIIEQSLGSSDDMLNMTTLHN